MDALTTRKQCLDLLQGIGIVDRWVMAIEFVDVEHSERQLPWFISIRWLARNAHNIVHSWARTIRALYIKLTSDQRTLDALQATGGFF